MQSLGVERLLLKELSENDNSKNQVYLGPDYSALRMLPAGELVTEQCRSTKKKEPMFIAKAALHFWWVDTEGQFLAPRAQLILYPQYPEVRMSGFLRDCANPPSDLMATRLSGRMMFLGVAGRQIFAVVEGADSPVCAEVRQKLASDVFGDREGVFHSIPVNGKTDTHRTSLCQTLLEIHEAGWIQSSRLDAAGNKISYAAQNGAGYTLEAACGISPNGSPLPDFLGWELKASQTGHWPVLTPGARITLMTPEPTAGLYAEDLDSFRERYANPKGPGAMYFTGTRGVGTGKKGDTLVLELEGIENAKILSPATASIVLRDTVRGEIAAGWPVLPMLEHWRNKHSRTAYIPYEKRDGSPVPEYRYSNMVRLAEGEDFSLLLKAFAAGLIVHDPGVKFTLSNGKWITKRRNQFRTRAEHIQTLYKRCADTDISTIHD